MKIKFAKPIYTQSIDSNILMEPLFSLIKIIDSHDQHNIFECFFYSTGIWNFYKGCELASCMLSYSGNKGVSK